METNNVQFTTSQGGQTLEMRPFITGRQAEALTLGRTQGDDKDTAKNMTTAHKCIELVVVSVGGKKDGDPVDGSDKPFSVLEAILDMPFADYTEVVEKVTELAYGKKNATNSQKT